MPVDYKRLYATYPHTIRKMARRQPEERWDFTSHEFIREWSHDNPSDYIEALHDQKDEARAFANVHGLLAQGLNQFPNLVVQAGNVTDQNIFGHQSPCMSWRRLRTTDPATNSFDNSGRAQ